VPAIPYTNSPGIAWPGLPHAAGATMLAMQYQLERSQWWPRERVAEQQLRQLRLLAAHATANVSFYREHLARAGLRTAADLDLQSYLRWPLLRRRDVQQSAAALAVSSMPSGHGAAGESFTTGSTGTPVRVLVSEVGQFFAHALVLRDHLWHERDFSAKFAAIRFFATEGRQPGWSPITNAVFATGASATMDVRTDVGAQLEWLIWERPAYLLTTPSNLRALLARSAEAGRAPRDLREVITYAEALPSGLRDRLADQWGARLIDAYSCTEAGALALQCPETTHYHVQSENVYVEILDEAGNACAPGETGRVVITPLHNFAMPLMRYELGDVAEAGEPCSCGRGLPVIRRVLGRVRNMAQDPTGRVFQPGFDMALEQTRLPVLQSQFVQRSADAIEMSYVAACDLSAAEMRAFEAAVAEHLRYPFKMSYRRVQEIAKSAGGKYEGFISLLTREADA
jgi:phenylacetate-CoA ligase